MSDNNFRLPVSSITELEKKIKGYANLGSDISLDDITKLIGIGKTTISKNNPFLTQIGIIDGGNTKNCTNIGKKLGRALEHNQDKIIKESWREIVQENDFLSKLISTIRIREQMTLDDLTGHILFAADQPDKSHTRTGARAVIDLLLESEFIKEKDGTLEVVKSENQHVAVEEEVIPGIENAGATENSKLNISPKFSRNPSISINIQLQLPETNDPEVYENLFKSLKKHLINNDDE